MTGGSAVRADTLDALGSVLPLKAVLSTAAVAAGPQVVGHLVASAALLTRGPLATIGAGDVKSGPVGDGPTRPLLRPARRQGTRCAGRCRLLLPPARTAIVATMVRVLLGQASRQPDDRLEQHAEDHRPFGEGDLVGTCTMSLKAGGSGEAVKAKDLRRPRCEATASPCTSRV